jgi:TrmH family RNA methyltransferase
LVFGREGTGLTNEELDLCDLIITIPASEEYPTLNISHAATTIFYELHSSNKDDSSEALADTNVRAKLLEFIENAAHSAGLTETEIGLATRALRNVMGRSAIRTREASSLAGTFRAIATKLKHPIQPNSVRVCCCGLSARNQSGRARDRNRVKVAAE